MTTIRRGPSRKYTQIDRVTINDKRLSFRARGILIWVLDKPDDWETNSEAIARQSDREGRDAIRTAMLELKACGYAVYNKQQCDGKWSTTITFHEVPVKTPGRTGDGFSAVGFSDVGFPGGSSSLTDTETENKEESYSQDARFGTRERPFCIKCDHWTDGIGPLELRCSCLRSVG